MKNCLGVRLCWILCSFDYRAFRWMMTMVFAVEEINRNSSLLPGVRLGYRIMDSCDHVHTSLQALFSLISYSKAAASELRQMLENGLNVTRDKSVGMDGLEAVEIQPTVGNGVKAKATEEVTCLSASPVPAVIGLASSSPTRAVADTLGPFSIPLVRNEQNNKQRKGCLKMFLVFQEQLCLPPGELFRHLHLPH